MVTGGTSRDNHILGWTVPLALWISGVRRFLTLICSPNLARKRLRLPEPSMFGVALRPLQMKHAVLLHGSVQCRHYPPSSSSLHFWICFPRLPHCCPASFSFASPSSVKGFWGMSLDPSLPLPISSLAFSRRLADLLQRFSVAWEQCKTNNNLTREACSRKVTYSQAALPASH